jgi:hypothetical protein
MQWLTLAYLLSIGTMNNSTGQSVNIFSQTPNNTYQITLGVEAQIFKNHLFIGGNVQTWEYRGNTGYFNPWESLYTFNAGFRFKGFEFGFRHECDHPVVVADISTTGFFGSKEEVYISYKGEINIF